MSLIFRTLPDWSGTAFEFAINASKNTVCINITFNNYQNGTFRYQININDDIYGAYEISPSSGSSIHLNLSLSQGLYKIRSTKLTEASYSTATGVAEIQSIFFKNADVLPNSDDDSSKLKVLFIGDSVTVAYGVDGEYPCSFSPSTENILHSYVALVADNMQAEYHILGWSGKGAVRNYGDVNRTSIDPMPIYYNRTLATDPNSYWNPQNFVPDLVYVMLGTNDYSTNPVPYDAQFIGGLNQLLYQIQYDYPSSIVVAACSPLYRSHQAQNIQDSANQVGANYLFVNFSVYDGGKGCDNHPSQQTQINIANIVTPFLEELLYYKSWNTIT